MGPTDRLNEKHGSVGDLCHGPLLEPCHIAPEMGVRRAGEYIGLILTVDRAYHGRNALDGEMPASLVAPPHWSLDMGKRFRQQKLYDYLPQGWASTVSVLHLDTGEPSLADP